jgi:hypothetical protein
MTGPEFEHLFDMTVTMGVPVPIGRSPYGDITFHHATGGRVEGPSLNGEVLPVGGDRVVGRSDGVLELNVQVLIRTDDGHNIYMSYKGLVDGIPGEPQAHPLYWRTAPFFETAAEPYLWLNRIVAVGIGQAGQGTVGYRIYRLL